MRRSFGLVGLFVAGCHSDHAQSALHPAGPAAWEMAWLWWLLLAVCTAVFLWVLVLTTLAVWPNPEERPPRPPLSERFILISGIYITGAILLVILVASLVVQRGLSVPDTEHTIRVIGHQWWWEVHYPDDNIVIANELHIPAGRPVLIELESADVIHSFWVPNLQGKTDMIPGLINRTWLASDREGVFRGPCAEYCGVQHALMAFEVVVRSPEDYEQWIAQRQAAAAATADVPEDDELAQRGRELYFTRGCNNCHRIAGTAAVGVRGPDLTHLANRRTLAAGVLPNTPQNLKAWIADPQGIKPGNLMPRTQLDDEELRALVAYLNQLN